MYSNETYEDYIRSILGYPNINNLQENNYSNYPNYINNNIESKKIDLENYYPEIYKIIYPMITSRCSRIMEPITEELIDSITNEIYSSIEVENEINLNINLQNDVNNFNSNNMNFERQKNEPKTYKQEENREDRTNNHLRDLIRILLIRELLKRQRINNNPYIFNKSSKPIFIPRY